PMFEMFAGFLNFASVHTRPNVRTDGESKERPARLPGSRLLVRCLGAPLGRESFFGRLGAANGCSQAGQILIESKVPQKNFAQLSRKIALEHPEQSIGGLFGRMDVHQPWVVSRQ